MMRKRGDGPSTTLADVIYAGGAADVVPEHDWAELVRGVAAGDSRAFDALYERTAPPVFTLIVRTLKDRAAAEELTVDVFTEIWQRAVRYDSNSGSVVAWIMNVARRQANDAGRLHRDSDRRAEHGRWAADHEPFDAAQQERSLRGALSMLTADERSAIEATLLSEQSYVEATAALEAPGGTKMRIRSGLGKLRLILYGTARRRMSQTWCKRAEALPEYVVRASPQPEAASLERHLVGCAECRAQLEELRHVVDALELWGMDILYPPRSVRRRLAQRIAADRAGEARAESAADQPEPYWKPVAPGIQVKMLSIDALTDRVSMLVRLAPGFAYPSHRHAGVEELHLLDGELWIDRRRLAAGDYNRADAGSSDGIVWSGTGCTCVLITSLNDVLQ